MIDVWTCQELSLQRATLLERPLRLQNGWVRNPSWLEQIVLGHTIYIPTPGELNDPREARPRIARVPIDKSIEMLYRRRMKDDVAATDKDRAKAWAELSYNLPRMTEDQVARMMEEGLAKQFETSRIYSLTKRANNHHLWEKYAANHEGYCLEFRTLWPFSEIKEVRYQSYMEIDATVESGTSLFGFFFYKRPKWQEEEELRTVGRRSPVGHVAFDPTLLTRIFLGKDMTPENQAIIREWAQKREPQLVVEMEPVILV